jgi:hypothetical protein
MDLTAMSNAERWREISEVMSFEVQVVEAAVTIEAEAAVETTAPEAIEIYEPRTPRVVSITELRQRLGIEETPLARSAPLPMTGRPRIVKRREAEAYPELAAG